MRSDFDQWTDYLVERVSKHMPPVIAYKSSATTVHAGAVLGTHVVQPGHGYLLIHDPEKGEFDWMRLTRARSVFRPDILSISPLRPWPPKGKSEPGLNPDAQFPTFTVTGENRKATHSAMFVG
jgi:hypothetical protein